MPDFKSMLQNTIFWNFSIEKLKWLLRRKTHLFSSNPVSRHGAATLATGIKINN